VSFGVVRLDVHSLLPSVLTVEDAAALLSRCSAVKAAASNSKSNVRVLAGTCVFSCDFLKVREQNAYQTRTSNGHHHFY
jgi:hypothetical protein